MSNYPMFSRETRELLAKATMHARSVTPLYRGGSSAPKSLIEDSLRHQMAAFLAHERVEHRKDEVAGVEVHELRLLCLTEEALFRLIREEAMRYDSQHRWFEPPPPVPMEHAP